MDTTREELFGYPLSFAQRRLWFLDQLFPGTPQFNLPLVLQLSLPVDAGVIERCLIEMGRRHEALRTTFRRVDGEPVQVVASEPDVRLRVLALDHVPEAEREAAAVAVATEDLQRPFDLATGPLWRATLVRFAFADHFLLLTVHHVVSDGWSMGLMLQELETLYTAFAAARASPLPELPLQYVDYAIWQRETLSPEVLARELGYWRETLADLPAIELPLDRARPAAPTLRARRHHFSISPQLRRALDELGQREGATPFMTLAAAYALLLYRYTGEADVPIGTPIAGRGRAELEPLIGLFVNTLVLRVDVAGRPTYRELLRRVRERALEAFAHQDLPFEKLVEELQPTRDLGRNPLFQVMFALQNAPTAGPEREARALRSMEVETGFTGFDLALDVWRRGDGYAARIEYSVDLFDADTVARLAGHWVALLEAIVAAPDRKVSEYRFLDEADTDPGAPSGAADAGAAAEVTVLEMIEQSLARGSAHRDAPAVCQDGVTLTYAEVDARSRALAAALRARGVGAERPVVVALERSPEVLVALLAVWRAGGVYAPLDPHEAPLRLRQVLADLEPAAVVTTAALGRLLGDAAVDTADTKVVLLDAPLPPATGGSAPDAAVPAPGQLACVVYTSGSTGVPRGVAVAHRSLGNHVRWMQAAFPLAPGERVLQTTSLGFDVSLWELAAPLVAGATVAMPPPGAEAEPAKVVALLRQHAVAALQTTPSFLRLVLDVPAFAACRALRAVFCGAEAMPRALAERFASSGVAATLHNMYGPTESTIDAASFTCPRQAEPPETRSGTVPIGGPIAGVRLLVRDATGERVPRGAAGELHVAGASLARGYWRRPGTTAARFVPAPGGGPGARAYRTGDRVRALRSGELEVLGRVDRQVKVRGVRVEPAEIERALLLHPRVREAFVGLAPSPRGELQLTAYVAADVPELDAPELSAPELRRFLQPHLARAMTPAAFVLVERLPRTSRGKVDAAALPHPEHGDAAAQRHTAPRTEVEGALAEVWRALLGVPRVGVHDSFFDLGGHSLLATQVVSRVLERFGVAVSLRRFFADPTVAGLAGSVEEARGERTVADDGKIAPDTTPFAPDGVERLSDQEVTLLLQAMLEREVAR